MRHQGRVVKWHADKGYGFLRATDNSKDVFLHISDINRLNKKPEVNDLVSYELIQDEKGRFRASHVAYQIKPKAISAVEKPKRLNLYFLAFILMFFAFLIERTLKGFLPVPLMFIFFGANLIVFLYYYQDKTSATNKAWRTPESTLHWLSLVGGWPGAYIAQKTFNHKHKKSSFVAIYKLTVLLNSIAVMLYTLPDLQRILTTLVSASYN